MKRNRASRIQAWYQNLKKHLILAQFSNSPWTGSHGIEACHGCVAESNSHISGASAVMNSRCTDLLRSTAFPARANAQRVHRYLPHRRSPGGLHVDEFEAISVIGRDFDFGL